MAKVSSLWVGNEMTLIQKMCLSSFIYHGHELTLFTYEKRNDVPNGVKLADANEIMPLDHIGNIANFADVFKYKMVQKTGTGWVDADTLCLTDSWSFLDDCYAILQDNGEIQSGIFKMPASSDFLQHIVDKSSLVDRSKKIWTDTSSSILIPAFEEFPHYKKYLVHEQHVNGVSFEDWEKLWKPESFDEILDLSQKIKSFSIYNEMVSRSGRDKNIFPKRSAMYYFGKKYLSGIR